MVCLNQVLTGCQSLINILLVLTRIYYTVGTSCSPYERTYNNANGIECVDIRWCRYKVYMDSRNWTDAKAICEQGNKTLLHITGSEEQEYMTSLLKTSLPAIGLESGSSLGKTLDKRRCRYFDRGTISFTSFYGTGRRVQSSLYWVGLYQSTGGSPLWQDNCLAYDVENNLVSASDKDEKCFMLNSTNIEYHPEECSQSQLFICKDNGNIDDIKCYSEAQTVYGKFPTPGYMHSVSLPTSCHPFCLASDCVGFQMVSGACRVFKYTSGVTYTKGGTNKYAKAITVRTSVDITNPVPSISDICKAVHVRTTTAILSTSTFDSVPTDSTSQSHITYISLDKPVSVSPETSLESSMASLVQSEITYERTPELSTDFTTILLEPKDHGTNIACSDCGCNSNHLTSVSPEELQSKIDELKKELAVKKEDLSSWKRKLISVPDDRVSAKSLGYLGAGLLAAIFGAIVLMDMPRFIQSMKSVILTTRGKHRGRPARDIS